MRLNRQTLYFFLVIVAVIVLGVIISTLQQQATTDNQPTTVASTLFSGVNVTDVARLSVTDETAKATTVYIQGTDGSWGLESTTTGGSGSLTQTTVDSAISNLVTIKAESFPA